MSAKPVVLVCSNRAANFLGTAAHAVRDTYVRALVEVAGCIPLLIPSIGKAFDIADLAGKFDGLLLTGSATHVAPSCYGATQEFEDEYLDMTRDATALPMLKTALDADIPTFAICRGFQELNVACGGTLFQYVHKVPGKLDHRSKPDITVVENLHNRAHRMKVQPGGVFESFGLPEEFYTNSLHTQGIDKVGKGLRVEAISEDGLVEAFSVPGKTFFIGTQWHPEGDVFLNPASARLFEEFGKVLRARIAR